jgi:hypothetical protein
MVAVPAATAVTRPVVVFTVANAVEELQVTRVVISWLVPSEYVPVAINCRVAPAGLLGLGGVTAMEVRVAKSTVRFVEPKTFPDVATMVRITGAIVEARPLLVIVAPDGLVVPQVTFEVRS